MTKQLVNIIGAAASIAILLLGLLVCALPQFTGANKTMADADDVASQNQAHQITLDTLTTQAADMSDVTNELAGLRQGIPETEHVEDILELAVNAATANGGRVASITPLDATAFSPRTAEVLAAGDTSPATGGEASAAPAGDTESAASEPADPAATSTAPPADVSTPDDGPRQVEVTVVIDTPDVQSATRVLDGLRSGPRLVAITQADVATDDESGTRLTATLLTFFRP